MFLYISVLRMLGLLVSFESESKHSFGFTVREHEYGFHYRFRYIALQNENVH